MTWLAWRQLRGSIIVATVGLVAIGILLLVTGLHLNHLYSAYRSCDPLTCDQKYQELTRSYPRVKLLGTLLIGLPALIGIFWGAPLVSRELENGTFRLAWTQGVTRIRWISTKLALGAAVSAIAAGLFTSAMWWWSIPFDRLSANRIDPSIFDQRGIAPVAYALFAFALGAAAGIIIRRTLPAIAATLVGFVAVRMVVQFLVRPHLLTPLKRIIPLSAQLGIGIERTPTSMKITANGEPSLHGAWVTSTQLVDDAGHAPTTAFVKQACQAAMNQTNPALQNPVPGAGKHAVQAGGPQLRAFQECIHNVGLRYHEVVSYQPESRFWELQWLESALFLGLTALLVGLSIYWVHRRLK
jgi:hypothetical protein